MYVSLTDTKQFEHVVKILRLSKEINWKVIITEAELQDSLNLDQEKDNQYKTPSIRLTILRIIEDLNKMGFKIKLTES